MKKVFKFAFIALVLILYTHSVDAAANVSVNNSNVNVDDSITVTITISNEAAWNFKLAVNGPVKYVSGTTQDVGDTGTGINGTKSFSATYKATGEGTATFSISGDTTSVNGDNLANKAISDSKTVTITKKQQAVTPPPVVNTSKSSDSTATSIKLNVQGMQPTFHKDTKNYTLSVDSSINSISVNVVPAAGAVYWVTGNNNLQAGTNKIYVYVTAQDGVTRSTYTITVTKSSNPTKSNAYLTNVIFDNATLTAEFTKEQFEYSLEDIGSDVEEIKLSAFPEDMNAQIETVGNTNLTDGENTIKIIVTAEDCVTKQEYIFKVNKAKKQEEPALGDGDENTLPTISGNVTIEEKNEMQDTQTTLNREDKLLILLYVFSFVEFIEIIYLFIELNKKNDQKEERGFEIPKFDPKNDK